MYILSSRFSSKTLIRLCEQIERKAIAGMVVIGENQAARSLTLAGSGMNIPVLWAKGGVAKMHGIGKEVSLYYILCAYPPRNKYMSCMYLKLSAHVLFLLPVTEKSVYEDLFEKGRKVE